MMKISRVFDKNSHSSPSQEMNYDATPRILFYGLLNTINFKKKDERRNIPFFIMPHYEMTLYQYLETLEGVEKIEKLFEVANKLICIFKYTHCAKRTYNDLKPSNVMINVQQDGSPKVHLIDFGYSEKFVKEDGKQHISEETTVEIFKGNIVLSSIRQMTFLKTSRKDDLISLFYMIIFLLNDEYLFVGDQDPLNGLREGDSEVFEAITQWKLDNDLPTIAALFFEQF